MEEGMQNLGTLVLRGNVPCIRCGFGDTCPASGVKMIHGPEATVESVGVRTFEEDGSLQRQARELAEKLRAAALS